ncbi:hypothetical protein ACPOLB_23570 [Rubrivivax sp. RP6-9]|uniref:hypothetical protein n=1 Tax=Rubrivivax sp. RP6-9 TaxID=3415750 RepID=UPI003CC690E6
MPLADLDPQELEVIVACLKCVAAGEVIKHDWEFQTVFGIEVTDILAVVDSWPNVDEKDETVALAINNSMVNLLGYPHGWHAKWDSCMSFPLSEIARVLNKWRSSTAGSYFDGLK